MRSRASVRRPRCHITKPSCAETLAAGWESPSCSNRLTARSYRSIAALTSPAARDASAARSMSVARIALSSERSAARSK